MPVVSSAGRVSVLSVVSSGSVTVGSVLDEVVGSVVLSVGSLVPVGSVVDGVVLEGSEPVVVSVDGVVVRSEEHTSELQSR